MLIELLFPVALTLLAVWILFKDKLLASAVTIVLFGLGYTDWGFMRVQGTPDDLVTTVDMTKVWTGLALVVIGGFMFTIWWFRDVRARNPR